MTGHNGSLLEARGLTKVFLGLAAAREISFAISPGEILGCLGPNGSGKSTIVKMITGFLEPTQGEVLYRGSGIRGQLAEYKRRMGYVPEQPELYSFLSGWEYLELVATLRGLESGRFREKAGALLSGLTLYSSRDAMIASYSKGMRQRIVLIAALLHDPEVLVLDEPFSGLDATSALVMRKVIALLAGQGKAVLFSSPVLEQAEKLCTHLMVLSRGSAVAYGTIEKVTAGFGFSGLEAGFMQLTEQTDADRIAQDIIAAVRAPAA